MIEGLYTKNDDIISLLVESAISSPDVFEVKNRTLDGKWHIQTIGSSANICKVKVSLTLAQKKILDEIKSTTDVVKVVFDNRWYIGLIDGQLSYDRRAFIEYPMFSASFAILVEEEGDI